MYTVLPAASRVRNVLLCVTQIAGHIDNVTIQLEVIHIIIVNL